MYLTCQLRSNYKTKVIVFDFVFISGVYNIKIISTSLFSFDESLKNQNTTRKLHNLTETIKLH